MSEPAAQVPAPPKERGQEVSDAPASTREPVVLVIDDEENCRQLYGRILTTIGCTIHEAKDGPSGLKLWRYLHPDLVILDVMMPGPNGFQLLEQARRESLRGAVIITTALMKKPLIEKAATLGVFSYIAKPFSVEKFSETVQAALPGFTLDLIKPSAHSHAKASSGTQGVPPASGTVPAPAPVPVPAPEAVAKTVPATAPATRPEAAPPTVPATGSKDTPASAPASSTDAPHAAPVYAPPSLEALQVAHPTPQELLLAIRDVLRSCASHHVPLPEAWIAFLTSGTSTQIAHLLEDTLAEADPALRAVLADCVSANLLRYSVHFVTSLLQDHDPDVACRALRAAKGIDDTRIRDLVFAGLMHSEVDVRRQACAILDIDTYPYPLRLLVRVLVGEECAEVISMNALRFLQKLAKDPSVFDAALETFPTQPQNIRKYIRQLVAYLLQDDDDTELVMTLLDERHLQTQKLGVEKVRKDVRKHFARKDASPS